MDRRECTHPVRVHGLCACCGEEVGQREERLFTALHHNTDVQINESEAEKHNEASFARLTKEKKMVLLLDLDQTVIHTSTSRVFGAYYKELLQAPANHPSEEEKAIREVEEINVDGFEYYVKKRDQLEWFLKQAAKYFEIHIYTMGNRQYGNIIAAMLDQDRSIFGSRIVTRDDNLGCFEKDLARIFPTNTRNVIILDDRPDVWGFSSNLFPIKPYTFFKTGDINSPEVLKGKAARPPAETAPGTQPASVAGHPGPSQRPTTAELVEQVTGQCIAGLFDHELPRVLQSLLDIHAEYFQGGQDVVELLRVRKQVFKGCVARFFSSSFESEKYLSSLFVHHGGSVDVYVSKRTTHVVIASGGIYLGPPLSKSIKYVNANWVYESIFALGRQPESEFVCQPSAVSYSGEGEEESDLTAESGESLYDQIVGDD